MKINAQVLLDASKEIDLEVNTETTKCMFMSYYQNTRQNYSMVANKSLENVVKFEWQ
jgi:hypothetical protein